MRLFIGLELDDAVRGAAADVSADLRRRLHGAAPDLVARWTAPDNLHITVWFIGEVAEPRAGAVHTALSAARFPIRAFLLTLAGLGAFPPRGSPRVFWIGLREGAAELAALYSEVAARLTPLGFERERRSYSAHLTIARVKDPGRVPARALRETLAAVPADCGTLRVEALTLFRSRLGPAGAAYEPLLRVPLAA